MGADYAADVDTALNNAFGQRQVSPFIRDKTSTGGASNMRRPGLKTRRPFQSLSARQGKAMPLLSIATTVGPGFLRRCRLPTRDNSRLLQFRSICRKEFRRLSQAQAAIDETRVKIGMPSTIVGSFQVALPECTAIPYTKPGHP